MNLVVSAKRECESKSLTRPFKSRLVLSRRGYRRLAPITIKFHVRAPLAGAGKPATVLLNTRSEKRLQQKCASVRAESRGSSESNRRRVRGTSFDRFREAIACLVRMHCGSILVGLLNAYPRVGTVARPEDCIEVRRRDESKISRGPMRLLRTSPPTKLCAVPSVTMCLR